MNRNRIYPDLIFTHFKKHNCPKCNNKLSLIEVSKVVSSESYEAKDYDFSFADNYLHGEVKFIWDEFVCDKCGYQININNLRQIEKEKKRKQKN